MEIIKKLCRFILKSEILSLTDRIANREKALQEMSERLQHREIKVDLYKTLQDNEVLVDDLQVIKKLHIIYANRLTSNESIYKQSLEALESLKSKGTDLPDDHMFVKENGKIIEEQRWITETTRRLLKKLDGIIN